MNEPKLVTNVEAKRRGLTRKQQAFVNELLKEHKLSGTQAALKVYGKPGKPTTYATADTISRSNLGNPRILQVLADHEYEAQQTIVTLMNKSRRDDIKLNAAKEVLNRVHGKTVETVDITTGGDKITPSSTSVVEEFGIWLKARTRGQQ